MSQSTATPSPRPPKVSFHSPGAGIFNRDGLFRCLVQGSGLLVCLMLASLVIVLFISALPSIHAFGFGFLTSTEWRPNEREQPEIGTDGKPLLDENGDAITKTIPPTFGA